MRSLIISILTLIILSPLFGQTDDRGIINDPEAEKLLKAVSKEFQSYKTVTTDFKMTIFSELDGINETSEGQVIIEGEKYRITTETITIVCDNIKRWIYLMDVNELQINYYEPDGESIESPTKLFNIYKEGFFYRLDGEENIGSKKHQKVKLIPQDLGNSQYKTIILSIDAETKRISKAVVKSSDGIDYIWELLNFRVNEDLPEDTFKFDDKKYPGITIEDMTQ